MHACQSNCSILNEVCVQSSLNQFFFIFVKISCSWKYFLFHHLKSASRAIYKEHPKKLLEQGIGRPSDLINIIFALILFIIALWISSQCLRQTIYQNHTEVTFFPQEHPLWTALVQCARKIITQSSSYSWKLAGVAMLRQRRVIHVKTRRYWDTWTSHSCENSG